MWHQIAKFIIRFRIPLIILIAAITAVMGYFATKVQMSYDSTGAIPTDNPKFKEFKEFQKKFGNNGNAIVLGIQSKDLFKPEIFADYLALANNVRNVQSVESVLSVADAVSLLKDSTGKLVSKPIFSNKSSLDSSAAVFLNQPIYEGLLHNPQTGAYLMMVNINKDSLASKARVRIIQDIERQGQAFQAKHNIDVHYSGLPYIRTQTAEKIKSELNIFLGLSLGLTALILLIIFRSFITMIVSMFIVSIGVIWSFGTLALLGYKISILTGVIPPLVVVIGIPNCIYFLNKYHTEFNLTGNKIQALENMVGKMGIVTLFTNLTAAIGFGVFYFTKSVVLKEFGLVAGLNIMALFFVSLILIPAVFSFLPPPKTKHTNYTESKWMNSLLERITRWVFNHRKVIFISTLALCVLGVVGMLKLRSVGHMVDDLPAKDRIVKDLKFFEKNFKGIMPLDIAIDTKKKYGALMALETWEKIETLTNFLEKQPEIGGGITLVKGVKFVKQGYADGDVNSFALPTSTEFGAIRPQLISTFRKQKENTDSGQAQSDQLNTLLYSFVDSNASTIRVSVNVADIGSVAMPKLIEERIRPVVDSLFSKDEYKINITGPSIIYLEGSNFIINSLQESLMWAFGMILVCIIILFRSPRIVLFAIITNIVPLLITAGVMGWAGITLKPSTVLVFSVALGITVDVTIRFLVSFKQELPRHNNNIAETVRYTIKDTGLSIIFTSIILVAGFGVFTVSEFGGTKALGYLTSLTLFLAMVFNLTLLPALLLGNKKEKELRSKP